MEEQLPTAVNPWDKRKIVTQSDVKKFNKELITRQLPRVKNCGHKFDPEVLPRLHCDECLFSYFNQSDQFVIELHNQYKENKQKLIGQYGSNFVRQFGRYMATIKKMEERKSMDGNQNMH
jgi:hypothetical protein